MNEKKKKIVGVGVLLICIVSMIHARDERESPSIGWMLALSATWAISVWLWPKMPPIPWNKICAYSCALLGFASLPLLILAVDSGDALFNSKKIGTLGVYPNSRLVVERGGKQQFHDEIRGEFFGRSLLLVICASSSYFLFRISSRIKLSGPIIKP